MAPAVLVYDADCGFCTASAAWIERHWPEGSTATAVAYQRLDPAVAEAAGVDPGEFRDAAYWLDGEQQRRGASAVAAALEEARGALGALGRALSLPVLREAAEPVYRVVARNRHRLPGSTTACRR